MVLCSKKIFVCSSRQLELDSTNESLFSEDEAVQDFSCASPVSLFQFQDLEDHGLHPNHP